MARIRTVKPEFWGSPDTAKAGAVARLLFISMWNWADDSGRGTANLKELEGFAFPNDDVRELSGGASDSFRHVLAEVRDCYGVVFYKVRGRPYYEIPSWPRHQRNERTAKGKYPLPSEGEPWDFMSTELGCDGTSETLRSTAPEVDPHRAEVVGSSGPGTGEQGNRGTGKDHRSPAAPSTKTDQPALVSEAPPKLPEPGSDDDPDWLKFWEIYPLRKAKDAARRAWRGALKKKGVTAALIIAGAERYRDDPARKPDFTAHPATWLNAARWADEASPPPGGGPYRNPTDPRAYHDGDL